MGEEDMVGMVIQKRIHGHDGKARATTRMRP